MRVRKIKAKMHGQKKAQFLGGELGRKRKQIGLAEMQDKIIWSTAHA